MVRHLVLRVADVASARRWIGATAGDDRALAPAITPAAEWAHKPETFFNLGITFAGLGALRLPASSLDSFPAPFVEGMAARNVKLGDLGESAPETWIELFRDAERVHVIASIYADGLTALDEVQRDALSGPAARAFELVGVLDGALYDGNTVHFGYRDNISQPRFEGIHDPTLFPDPQPLAPLGTVLLGHPTAFEGVTWRVPQPVALGNNGAFNTFRILAQDTSGFEAFLDDAADAVLRDRRAEELLPLGAEAAITPNGTRHDAIREVVAAKLCGRWRDGTSLELSPQNPSPTPVVSDTDFDYVDDGDGLRCPIGAHTRRCNPRGARSCSGSPTAHAGSSAGACRTGRRSTESTPTMSSAGCSATSSAPTSRRSSSPSTTTGSTSGSSTRSSPVRTTRCSAPTTRPRADSTSRPPPARSR